MKYSEWNIAEKFDFIVWTMRGLADIHIPVRKSARMKYELKLKPWITQGIVSSIKHRYYLFRIYVRPKLLTDFETCKKASRLYGMAF